MKFSWFVRSAVGEGGFQQTGIAIAVPKGHPEALAYVTKFIEDAKASGSVRRTMDRAGMANLAVAPPERASEWRRGRSHERSQAHFRRLRERPLDSQASRETATDKLK